MYIHGGGFFSGDKAWSEKVWGTHRVKHVTSKDEADGRHSQCYANIGYHFAGQGIVTVVVNHQLVPHVQYPGGADDMQLAREWVYENISKAQFGSGSVEKVFLFGHSSGGAHVAMNLYAAGAYQPSISSTGSPIN